MALAALSFSFLHHLTTECIYVTFRLEVTAVTSSKDFGISFSTDIVHCITQLIMARRRANFGREEEETVAIFVLSFNSRLIHISEGFYVDAGGQQYGGSGGPL